MKRSIAYCFLLLLVGFSSFSQSEEELENDLLILVNEYRSQNNLPELEQTDLLSAVAFDQAEYILKTNKVSHEQEKGKKENLEKRILYYEGLYAEAGENATIIGLESKAVIEPKGERVTIKNDHMALQAAVMSWLDEEEGKANLNDPNFYRAGVSVLINEKSELVIVLVMASLPYENDQVKKIPLNVYGIKEYSKEVCAPFLENYPTLPQLFSDALKEENGKVFFEYHDLGYIKNMMNQSKASFAVDAIQKEQFPCSEGNRLFPTSIAKGFLMPPVTKSVLNLNNLSDSIGEVKINLGQLPAFYDASKDELNLAIMSDGHHCTTVPFNRLISKNNNSIETSYLLSGESDSSVFVWADSSSIIFYPRINESWKSDITDYAALLEELSYQYEKIQIEVEEFILPDAVAIGKDDFLLWVEKGATLSMVNSEEKFKQKIQGTFFQLDLQELDGEERVNYIVEKQKADSEFKLLLDSLTKVELITQGTANVPTNLNIERQKELYLKMMKSGKDQLALFFQTQLIKSGNKKAVDVLLEKEFPQTIDYLNYINNQIVLAVREGKSTFDGNPIHLAFLELYLINQDNPVIKFNLHKAKLNHWKSAMTEIKDFDAWLKEFKSLKGKLGDVSYQRELLNYYLLAVDYYFNKSDFAERKKSFTQLMKVQKSCKLDDKEKLSLAQFLCYQDQFDLAVKFLKSELTSDETDENLLFYYLQIAQYVEEDFPSKFYVEQLKRGQTADPERFCELFSKNKMGVQLLGSSRIKELYCDSCS